LEHHVIQAVVRILTPHSPFEGIGIRQIVETEQMNGIQGAPKRLLFFIAFALPLALQSHIPHIAERISVALG
jgi:hypothetical protein